MKHKLLNYFFLLSLVVIITGCKEDKNFSTPKLYQVIGKVEKGPFINGSKITAQALDENYNLTGEVYQGTIVDDDGSFDLGDVKLVSPYVLLTADGYYFNEIEGELSSGQISMQSLVNLSDKKQANVNVLTHLKTQRMMQLLKNNRSAFDEVDKQVQKEVLSSFGLERYANKNVCNFSIASGTDEAGALIVVSSALLKSRSDAQLTEYLAQLSTEFKIGGTFTETTKKQLREDAMGLDVNRISTNIAERYKDLGVNITVPNLNLFVDWDGDGIAGNEPDAGGDLMLTLDKTELLLPAEGGTYRIKIHCKAPVTLKKPDWVIDSSVSEESIKFLKYTDINYEKSIVGDELVIVAQSAAGALMSATEFTVYTTSGKLTTKLKLTQQGDPSKKVELEQGGQQVISGIAYQMMISMQDFSNLDGYYTQSFNGQATAYRSIYDHSLKSYDSQIESIWSNTYVAVSRINMLKEAVETNGAEVVSSITPYIHQLAAVQYFQLASWWENVPYVTSYSDPLASMSQLASKTLFAQYIDDVNYCIAHSKPELGRLNSVESILYPPKGASLALLAKMYLHQKSYQQTYDCLKQIIGSNVYTLNASATASLAENSKELVWGLLANSQQESRDNVLKGNFYVPFITYAEVLLSAAECAYHLGNQAEAQGYLNKVATARGLALRSDIDFMEGLRSIWQSELKGFGSYFAFLRRNNLTATQLKIESYQQLLPIPGRELSFNPAIVQNPGWK